MSLSPLVNNDGNGEPKGYTGMVGTHHRPSDDLSTFGSFTRLRCNLRFGSQHFLAFLTPANAMLSVELEFLADIMEATGHGSSDITSSARMWSGRIRDALWNTTVWDSVKFSVMS